MSTPIPNSDASSAQPIHVKSASILGSIGGSLGNGLLQFAMTVIVPYALALIHLDPTLLARYQDWDAGIGPAELPVGEIAHGIKIGHVKNAGVAATLVRH